MNSALNAESRLARWSRPEVLLNQAKIIHNLILLSLCHIIKIIISLRATKSDQLTCVCWFFLLPITTSWERHYMCNSFLTLWLGWDITPGAFYQSFLSCCMRSPYTVTVAEFYSILLTSDVHVRLCDKDPLSKGNYYVLLMYIINQCNLSLSRKWDCINCNILQSEPKAMYIISLLLFCHCHFSICSHP